MELRHLRYFIAVAEELHFGRAAERLHMSQQPLSVQIRSLESELGVDLLIRSENRIRLSPAGLAFLDEARSTIARSDHAIAVAREARAGLRGRLRVGHCTGRLQGALASALRSFLANRPDVSVDLVDVHGEDSVRALEARAIDVAITQFPGARALLSHRTLVRDRFVVALAKDTIGGRSAFNPAKFRDETIIALPRSSHPEYRVFLDRVLSFVEAPVRVHEVSDPVTLLSLVAGGVGVALIADGIAASRPDDVAVLPLEADLDVDVAVSALWRTDEDATLIAPFIDELARALD